MVPVRLRGHHFLCMLTFVGKGYSDAFVANMTQIIERIGKGAPIETVVGPDDICAGLSAQCRAACDHDCTNGEIDALDRQAVADVERVLGRTLLAVHPVTADDVARLRNAFRQGTNRTACVFCRWKSLCDNIAQREFTGTLLP